MRFFFLLLSLASARAEEPEHIINNNGFGIIAGPALVEVERKIFEARVITPRADGAAVVELDKKRQVIPAEKVAVIDDANCWRGNSAICVGDQYQGKKVLGYFPTSGDVIIREGDLLRRQIRSEAPLPNAPPAFAPLSELSAELKKRSRLHLRDFLQTWDPHFSLPPPVPAKECENHKLFGRKLKVNEQGIVDPACAPKVLYSWSLPERFRWFRQNMGAGAWTKKNFPLTLFSVRSPAATFGYGSFDESGGQLMRLELAPGVRFKFLGVNSEESDCQKFPAPETQNTVYARVIGGTDPSRVFPESSSEDFFVCGAGPIQAWSSGTREIYDELSADTQRALSAESTADWDAYTTGRAKAADPFRPIFLDNVMGDAQPFTQRQLLNSFKKLLPVAAANRGERFVNPANRKKKRPSS